MNRTREVSLPRPTLARIFFLGAVVFSLLALVGCQDEQTGVTSPDLLGGRVIASVLEERADPGEAVRVRFVNKSEFDFSFSACARQVERLVNGAWTFAAGAEAVVCAAVLDGLRARSERSFYVSAPSGTPPGIYRFVFTLSADESWKVLKVASEPFDVR